MCWKPRILADHHTMSVVTATKRKAAAWPDLQGHIRRDLAVGSTPNAVGARHLVKAPAGIRSASSPRRPNDSKQIEAKSLVFTNIIK
jgi:hypothetical protein